MSDAPERSDGADVPSIAELAERVARDSARLAAHEAALGASQHVPQLRRVAVGAGTAGAIVLAFLTAFALANAAALLGLDHAMPTWLAALLLAAFWAVVGILLTAILRARLRDGSTGVWIKVLGDDREAAVAELQASRDVAERDVRESLDRFGDAVAAVSAARLADAALPFADTMGDALLGEAEEVLEAMTDSVPGAGAIGQVVDVVLFPGRLGLRIATTVFRGSPEHGRSRDDA
jgi:Putative Actinobacterial Holin-X, holin superfamily III